ncbi:MAG: hypothetical protein LUF00_00295 [Lachnospiraceae bacterium]|nr:hypothetical protein [Lachnospiraceae bacterium]
MPIPKAAPGTEYAYYFQYMIFVRGETGSDFFLDTYRYSPVYAPLYRGDEVYLVLEDLRRIYAPDMHAHREGGRVRVTYGTPLLPEKTEWLEPEACIEQDGQIYIPVRILMERLGKISWSNESLIVVAVDGYENPAARFAGPVAAKKYRDLLTGRKGYGELNYTLWLEGGQRLIPYRMYIPSSYRPGVPNKTIICFHGGDANPDYMFKHTHNEIAVRAEREGYILLALCSYRKYTGFGGMRLPNNGDREIFNAGNPNPCGLSPEELEWSVIAERSVAAQIEDAAGRFDLDRSRFYAIGNSAGSMGIFLQVGILPAGTFRAVSCSGGCPLAESVGVENLKIKGTKFLLLMGSEDELAGQRPFYEDYPYLKEHGLDIVYRSVGGGTHLLGWTHGLDEIFDFFRAADAERE